MLQLLVTALFYLENSRKIHLRAGRSCQPKDVKRRESGNMPAQERETPSPMAPLFICFLLSPGLPYVNWDSQECCLFYLRSSLQSSDLPLFYFHRLSPSLSSSHCHSGLLFPILIAQHFLNMPLSHFLTLIFFHGIFPFNHL